MNAAGPEIGRVKTCARCAFIEHHQLFALFKAPEWRGECANVHRLCGHVQKVRQHAADFGIQYADQGSATRHNRACQLFNGQAPSMFLVHWRHVIEPVQIWQVL